MGWHEIDVFVIEYNPRYNHFEVRLMQIQDLLIEMEALSADDPRYLKKALQTLRLERCRLLENGHSIQKQLDDLDYVIAELEKKLSGRRC